MKREKEIEKRRDIYDSLTNREDINQFIFYGCFHFVISNLDNEKLSSDTDYKKFCNACIRHSLDENYSDTDIAILYLYCRVFKNSLPTAEEMAKQRKEEQELSDRVKEEAKMIDLMIPLFSTFHPIIEIKTNNKEDGKGVTDNPQLIEQIKAYLVSKYKDKGFYKKALSLEGARAEMLKEENYQWVNAYKDSASVQFLMLHNIDEFEEEMALEYANTHSEDIESEITYEYLLKRRSELEALKPKVKRGAPIKTEKEIQFSVKLGYLLRFHKFIKQEKSPTMQEYLEKEALVSKDYRAIHDILVTSGIIEKQKEENTTSPEKYLRSRLKNVLKKEEDQSTEDYLTHLRSYLRNETNFTPLYTNLTIRDVNYDNYTID